MKKKKLALGSYVWICWQGCFLDFPIYQVFIKTDVRQGLLVISIAILVCFLVIGSLRSVCIRLYARDRGGDCSLEEPLPTAKRNA